MVKKVKRPQNSTFKRSHKIHSLKYQRCTTLGCTDIGILHFEFVAKTHFLCNLTDPQHFFLGVWTFFIQTNRQSQTKNIAKKA